MKALAARSWVWFSLVLGSMGPVGTMAQNVVRDSIAGVYAATITYDDLHRHLSILASDSLEGRDTGREGQKKAAAYLRQQFMSFGIPEVTSASYPTGLQDGYFQTYDIIEEGVGDITLSGRGRELVFMKDILYFDHRLTADLAVERMTFAGNGAVWMDPKSLMERVVLIMDDGSTELSAWMVDLRRSAAEVTKGGGVLLLASTPRFKEIAKEYGHLAGRSNMRLADDPVANDSQAKRMGAQTIIIDDGALRSVIGGKQYRKLLGSPTGHPIPVHMQVRTESATRTVTSENVLAYIEGSDLKNEVVVITAHYDHIGMENGEVYNGADDDGSGTVALLEIAEAFAKARSDGHGPRRSILIMPVSGEEKGLLGSRYYSEHPVFPLEQTVANLNIDMIGRVDSAHAGSAPYVYIIGSDRLSTELHVINETSNRSWTGLELDYTFNAPDDPNRFYYRSDHYNFARKGVPCIFYFSGVHEDYHGPGDEVDKIMFDLLKQRTLLVFHTAWALADRDQRIAVDGLAE